MRKRFLIVEDEALSRKIMEDFLSEFAECHTAADGEEAFKLFEQAILDGKPYHLVCTDLVMPKVDGYELIKNIRACEQSLPIVDCLRTRIFVISGSDDHQDMSRALLDCDGDDYIVKPFRREQMRSVLEKYNLIDYANEP